MRRDLGHDMCLEADRRLGYRAICSCTWESSYQVTASRAAIIGGRHLTTAASGGKFPDVVRPEG